MEGITTNKSCTNQKVSFYKRAFDILFAGTLLILLLPLLIVVAILIKMESKGSVFCRESRVGMNYKIFTLYKFRTKHVNAEELVDGLVDQSHQPMVNHSKLIDLDSPAVLIGDDQVLTEADFLKMRENENPFVKNPDNSRITNVGRLIRKTGIDKLPQLVNVLNGDMSVVGNRPLPLNEAEKLTNDLWSDRLMTPVGLTCI